MESMSKYKLVIYSDDPSHVLSPPLRVNFKIYMDCLDCLTTYCFVGKNMPCMPGRYLDHPQIAWTEASCIQWIGVQDFSSCCVQMDGPSLQACSNIWRHSPSGGSL
jgi:hypothetical protein